MNVNNKGRAYTSGKSCHDDLKWLIISKCLEHGGDPANCFLPVAFNSIAQETGVATNTVRKIWNQFCSAHTLTPFSKGGNFSSKLSAGDLALIETLKTMRGSISLGKIASCARRHRRRARHFSFSFMKGNKIQVTFWKEIFEKENNTCGKSTIYL